MHAFQMRARDVAVSSLAAAGSAGAGAGGIYASGKTSAGKFVEGVSDNPTAEQELKDSKNESGDDSGKIEGNASPESKSQLHSVDQQGWPQSLKSLNNESGRSDNSRSLSAWPESKELTSACMSVEVNYGKSGEDKWIRTNIRLMGMIGDNEAITVFTIISSTDVGDTMMNTPWNIRHQVDYWTKSGSSWTKGAGFNFMPVVTSTDLTFFSTFKLTTENPIRTSDSNWPDAEKAIKGMWYLVDEGTDVVESNPISITDSNNKEFTFLGKEWSNSDKDAISSLKEEISPKGKLLTVQSGKKWKWESADSIKGSLSHCSL